MSRAAKLARLRMLSCALGARLFPPSKWAGLFPSAAYRRSAPRSWRGAYAPLAGWDASLCLGIFCSAKGQRDFDFTLAFVTSHEACRRMAAYAIQAAGNRTRPASRGTCRATAVTSRPSRMSPEHPARLWRAVRGAGVLPLLLPETFGVVVFELAVGGFGKTKGKPFVEKKIEAGKLVRTGKHLAAEIGPGFG